MIARFLILLAAAGCLFAEGAGYRIYSGCDEHEDVLAEIQKDTPLTVRFSIAGGSVCYSVTANVGGKTVHGYVLDRALNAVESFDKARAKNERESFENIPIVSAKAENPPTVKPPAVKQDVKQDVKEDGKQDTVKADPKPEKKYPPPPKMSM
jgi:hypothetical protein